MEQANNLIEAYRNAENVSVIYTIRTSGLVRNNGGGTMRLSKVQSDKMGGKTVARLSVSGDDICRTGFFSMGNDKQLTVSSGNTSTFYVSQISFVTSDKANKGTILIVGLGTNTLPYNYSLELKAVAGSFFLKFIRFKVRRMLIDLFPFYAGKEIYYLFLVGIIITGAFFTRSKKHTG